MWPFPPVYRELARRTKATEILQRKRRNVDRSLIFLLRFLSQEKYIRFKFNFDPSFQKFVSYHYHFYQNTILFYDSGICIFDREREEKISRIVLEEKRILLFRREAAKRRPTALTRSTNDERTRATNKSTVILIMLPGLELYIQDFVQLPFYFQSRENHPSRPTNRPIRYWIWKSQSLS